MSLVTERNVSQMARKGRKGGTQLKPTKKGGRKGGTKLGASKGGRNTGSTPLGGGLYRGGSSEYSLW